MFKFHLIAVSQHPAGPWQELVTTSHWTLPHDLAAVVLIEQLYRAMTIDQHKTYHY